jgi:fused signal recognition particle receptor
MLNLVSRFKKSLQKTQDNFTGKLKQLFAKHDLDEDLFEELEEALICADLSVEITMTIIDKVRQKVTSSKEATYDVYQFMRDEMSKYLPEDLNIIEDFEILLILGVNGSGKTTSIAKMAQYYKKEGRSVILAAADTFRAAASEQLETWAKRVNVPLVKTDEGSDPSSVVYEAIDVMHSQKKNLLIIDTAGRLHTKKNLMDELAKMKRTITKQAPRAKVHTRLVLDATTGNNGLQQALHFGKEIGINDLFLAKLDSSAKGGFIFSIAKELSLPVRYVGVGESLEDMVKFSRKDFVEALFD